MWFSQLPHRLRAGAAVSLLCLFVSLGAGCQRSADDHPHPHPHPHPDDVAEVPSVAVTAWSDRHEVFAEYTLPVEGELSRFATHVSVLADGSPRRAGSVTYRLQPAEGEPLAIVDPQPARDGIYLTEFPFPGEGTWRLSLEVPASDAAGAPDAAAAPDVIELGEVLVHPTASARAQAAVADEPEGISFLKEQQWLFGTLTSLAEPRAVEESVTVPGRIRPAPERHAEVVPPVAGRLVAPDGATLPRLGQRVEAGQVLAWIEPPVSEALLGAITLEADLARLQVEVDSARAVEERTRLLHQSEARSDRELEQAEFALASARAAHEGTRRALEAYAAAGITSADGGMPRFAVAAPLSGVVDEIHAVAGQSVTTEDPILHLVDASRVHVEAQVRVEDLPRMDTEGPPNLSLDLARTGAVVLPPADVRLAHIGLEVDERTGRAPVVFDVANPGLRWRPGTAVDVQLATGRAARVLSIPTSALITQDGAQVVFVQLGGETFERRVVTTGLADREYVELLSGLVAGERVVSDGAYAVRLASVSTTEASHGHAH